MTVIASTDLLFPAQRDPIGLESGGQYSQRGLRLVADPVRYIAWVDALRGNDERTPRLALHLAGCPVAVRRPRNPEPKQRRDLPSDLAGQPRFANRTTPRAGHAKGATLEELLAEW